MPFIALLYLSLLCYIGYCFRIHTQRMRWRVFVNRAPNFVFGARGGADIEKTSRRPAFLFHLAVFRARLSDNDTSNMFIEVK